MTKFSLFTGLTTILALATLPACVSTTPPVQTSATIAETREPATIKTDALAKKIELHDPLKNDFEVGDLNKKTFSIENREDRLEFKVKVEALLARKDERMPKEGERALEEALRCLAKLNTETPAHDDFVQLQEAVDSFNSNFLTPVPQSVWLAAVPYEAIKMLHHSIMNKRAPEAVNLTMKGLEDSSKVDPKPSTFWKPGRDASKVDMYNGFGRAAIPKITAVCKYDEPKKSYGTHGGFKLDCGTDGKWKVKFGNESKTEPFNSRLVWAMGYNVTEIDYLPEGTRVEYDRKLISEYNSRKDLKLKFKSILGFTYFSKNLQIALNPFEDAVAGAVLDDGTTISSEKLRAKLIKSVPKTKKGNDDWARVKDAKFNETFEKSVKYILLRQASLEGPRSKELEEIGSWSWRNLDHPDRRELRAFALMTAWVNAFDMRQNNNKTFLLTKPDGTTELVHQVSDLGSGFGRASNIMHYRNGELNRLPWELVRLRANEGDGDGDSNEEGDDEETSPWVSPYKFPGYSVIEKNLAFSRMQIEDAKWMTRKLASLSEDQIQDALIAAGFTAAETKLVLEKLLDRRQQMIDVFDLTKEFPELMERKINRRFSFDPKKDAVPKTKNAANPVAARITSQKIVKGELVPEN